MSDLILPKTYKNDASGNYPQHFGKFKISYSQFSSWKDPKYKLDYIRQYFMGVPSPTNIYAQFGSACGLFFEKLKVDTNWLTASDVEVLERLERPLGAVYEGEVIVDCGAFVIQGFIDQETQTEEGLVIKDLKTGNVDNKVKFYGSQDYQQTTLYSHVRELEGHEIAYSGVILLGRKGNGENHGRLRLSGVIEEIPTPYTLQRAQKFLAEMLVVAHEISQCYKLYLRLNV